MHSVEPVWTPGIEDEIVALLEISGRYRVLRRFEPRSRIGTPEAGASLKWAAFVAIGTTGPDPTRDVVFNLSLVPFSFDAAGRIYSIGPAYSGINDPGLSVPGWFTDRTGLDSARLAGRYFDYEEIEAVLTVMEFLVAHPANRVRPFLEKISGKFKDKPWACSQSEVDWLGHGHESASLKHLGLDAGFFFDEAGWATPIAQAAVELLARPLGTSGDTALAHLLREATRTDRRIWIHNVPADRVDWLRTRGYRWGRERPGHPAALYRVLRGNAFEPEIAYLECHHYVWLGTMIVEEISWLQRHSDRG